MSTFNRDSTFMSFCLMNSWTLPYDLLKCISKATFLTLSKQMYMDHVKTVREIAH